MVLLGLKRQHEAFREIIPLLFKYRQLTWEMTKRDITDRYSGQVFGAVWAIIHPLVLMGIYVFIFAFVFKTNVGHTKEMPLDYTIYLLSGLIPWLAFQEALIKGATSISSNANLVKQVVFPIEVLPVKGSLATLFSYLVSTVILIGYTIVSHQVVPWTYIFLPFLFILQLAAMIGVSYVLSAVGAYFLDLKDVLQVVCLIILYLMPVFYTPQMVPQLFKPFLYVNPLSHMIWCYQDVIYFGRIEHPMSWVIFPLISMGTFCFGYRFFRKLKVFFGNVL